MAGPDLAREIWWELKSYINEIDRGDAAETLVSMLVDQDFDVDDIKSAFKGDSHVRQALASYAAEDAEAEQEDEDDEEEYY
jgi:hypothetical protein